MLVLTSAMMVKTSLDTDKIADFNAEYVAAFSTQRHC